MRFGSLLLVHGLLVLQGSAFAPSSPPSNKRSHSSTTTRLYDTPEPLASEGDWSAYLDLENTGVVYYFNSRTGESLWEPPTRTFPSVYLKPSLKRKAEAKKSEYYKSIQEQEEKKGFLSSLFDSVKKEDENISEEEEPEWMKGILEEKYPSEQEEEKPGLFSKLFSAAKPETTTPAPAPAPEPITEELTVKEDAPPKKGFLDNLFESISVDTPSVNAETKEVEDARIAQQETAAAEKEAAAAKRAEEKKKEEERKQAEEEAIMMERVRKAEAEQKAEADRLAAEAAEQERLAAAAAKEAKQADKPVRKVPEQIIVEEKITPIKIDIGSCVLPHPSKIMWGGEDAVFTKGRTFGVFDGVSGADKMDGLPLYSKMLARQMTQLVGDGNDLTIKDMQDYLLKAAEIADERATGASTAVVASITENGFLRAINLGDSYCVVVRGDKIVAKTQEIVHYFDCPYQLSDISPDRPRDARKLNFELLKGDIVIMGSDGIFDNLDDSEIIEIVKSGGGKSSAIAKKISDRSRKVSLNNKAPTPYAKAAKKNGDPDFRDGLGGKVDDISCVVVQYQ